MGTKSKHQSKITEREVGGDGRGRLASCFVPSSSSSSSSSIWPCQRLLMADVSLSSSQGGFERQVGGEFGLENEFLVSPSSVVKVCYDQ
jgi:hypothetical protein